MEPTSKDEGGIRVFEQATLSPGWKFDKLGHYCTIRRGASPRPAGDPRYFGGGTIPWIKIGDATRTGGRYLESTEEHVNVAGAERSVHIPAGSLIIANSGVSLGFATITRVPGCIHDGWLLATEFRNLDRDYLYYCINVATRRIRQMADGTTQPNLNTDIARRLILPIPPLPEQRAIAHILGSLDDKIELNRRMNRTLEAMAQALFKSWFVDPVQGGLPEGWREGEVSNLVTISREGLSPGDFPDETFDHYSIPAFDEGRTPKSETGQAIKSNKFIVQPGCVMMSKLNPRIPRICLPELDGKNRAVCSTEFLVTVPEPSASREFLYCLFRDPSFISVFATMVTGTSGSHQRVKPESLLKMEVAVPPQPLIQRFTATIAPLLSQISQNIRQSRTLAQLRDTLLPQLLSGELRIKDTKKFL